MKDHNIGSEVSQLAPTVLDTGAKVALVCVLARAAKPMLLCDAQALPGVDAGAIRAALVDLVRKHIVLVSADRIPTIRLGPGVRGAAFDPLMRHLRQHRAMR